MRIDQFLKHLVARFPASAEVVNADVAVLAPDGSGLIEAIHYEADDEGHEDDDGGEAIAPERVVPIRRRS